MKSIKKFKTITEISNSLKLPQHVLRFWESKFKQLKPLKLSGNRRYYREIGYIKNLLHEDCISIRGVQKIFANQTINQILKTKDPMLRKKNVLIDNKNIKKDNFKDSNKEYKKIFKEILIDLKNIKNSI